MTSQTDSANIRDMWHGASDKNHPLAPSGTYTTTRRLEELVHTPGEIENLIKIIKAIYGNIEMDQMISIISFIGFGQLLYSTPKDYDHNLLSDLEELLDLFGEYNSDKERLVVLIKMVSNYFIEYKTIVMFEKPCWFTTDMILRSLILEILSDLTHPRWCLSSNNTILRSAIEQTSYKYNTPLPGINDLNINDNDGILTHELVPNLSPPVDRVVIPIRKGMWQ